MPYEVLIYGDSRLRQKAERVKTVDDRVRELARRMLKSMYEHDGIGLATEQVGRREALCVVDVPPVRDPDTGRIAQQNPDVKMPLILVNPVIEAASGAQTGSEGCLSFPGIYVSLQRAAEVTVRFTGLDNREDTVHARGLLARTIQHELDHLEGVLLVDRMSSVQKVAVAGRLKRLKKAAAG